MEKAPDHLSPKDVGGALAPAANDEAIERSGRPAGWDPFEVWRTRVKAVQDSRVESQESRES